MTGFLFFVFFLYLLSQTIISLLFYLGLWQEKEYRWDRLVCHLKTASGRKKSLRFFNILSWKGLPQPVWTLKTMLLFVISFLLTFRVWFALLRHLPLDFSWRGVISLVLVNWLMPVLVSFSVLVFQPFSWLAKRLVFFLATKKLSARKDLTVIGITGSFAKTSVKMILTTLLSAKYRVLKTPENWNTAMGVAKTILLFLRPEHQVLVVEMAAYRRGEIKEICNLVHPQIGILTGVNEQHLPLFGSLPNIVQAKYELIQALPRDGLAVFNSDNQPSRQLAQRTKKIKKILYSLAMAKNIKVGKQQVSFTFQAEQFSLSLLGRFQVLNFLAALSVVQEMGLSLAEVKKASRKIKPWPGTMSPFLGLNKAFFIDDSYNANPDGFLAALDYLKRQKGRKIIIARGMIELGQATDQRHRQVAREAKKTADLLILTRPDPLAIIKKEFKAAWVEENPEKLIAFLKQEIRAGDIILLEGRMPAGLMTKLKP